MYHQYEGVTSYYAEGVTSYYAEDGTSYYAEVGTSYYAEGVISYHKVLVDDDLAMTTGRCWLRKGYW